MKYVLTISMLALWAPVLLAQSKPGEALTREQKWQIEKTASFMKVRSDNRWTDLYLKNYAKIIASGIFCKNKTEPGMDMQLQGKRLNTMLTALTMEIANQKEEATFIIERRFDSPVGDFDSVGMLQGRFSSGATSKYQFTDANDYPGKTWYRIRIKDQPGIKKLVSVQGYNNSVKVFPNPASGQSELVVAVNQFKTDDQTSLLVTDAMGRVHYTVPAAFKLLSTRQVLTGLHLAPGLYYVKVSNAFNSGVASFMIK